MQDLVHKHIVMVAGIASATMTGHSCAHIGLLLIAQAVFVPKGSKLLPLVLGCPRTVLCIFSIMADMADVDELITSVRRPGIVSGMATFARKISAGMSNATIGFLLSAVGYDSVLANSKIRQSLETQRGIVYIFVFVPAILMVLLIIVGYIFPLTGKEFRVVQTEIARRKGEDPGRTTDEEKQICEKVTGISYDKLWNPANTLTKGKNA